MDQWTDRQGRFLRTPSGEPGVQNWIECLLNFLKFPYYVLTNFIKIFRLPPMFWRLSPKGPAPSVDKNFPSPPPP